MRLFLNSAGTTLLGLACCLTGAAHAQQAPAVPPDANALASATVTSNVPPRAGEASTMTNGVPNLLTSNVQPGELGIQTRLILRKHVPVLAATSDLRVMGAAGPMRPD